MKQDSTSNLAFSKHHTVLAVVCLIVTALFFAPIRKLIELATSSDLYSHTILIPFVSLYLTWETARAIDIPNSRPARLWSIFPLSLGALSLIVFFTTDFQSSGQDAIEDYLAYSIFAYVCFIIACCFFSLGKETVRTLIFPILFLLFLVPFPSAVREGIQSFFQHTSAELSYWFIKTSGVPIFREGLIFNMPTIVMEVAPQCSGLRSSLVLFIVSMIASFLFLKSPVKRSIFVFLVIPIGILRNAIRILILALQCYHIGPEEIHGWFHRQGGQPLFAVTLIPLFATLYFFWKSEKTEKRN